MKAAAVDILLLFAVLCGSALAAEGAIPVGMSSHDAAPGSLAFTVYRPREFGREPAPLLVLLHETGFTDRDSRTLMKDLAEEGGYVVLCPRAQALGFAEADLAPLLATVSGVGETVPIESVHLLGIRDSARQAVLFAYARPKLFRSVVMLGADLPFVRPPRAASSLRVLAMKTDTDRPVAGRESVQRMREHVEVAEFRRMGGDPRMPDAAARRYLVHFVDAAAGRVLPGRDLSFPWRTIAAGLAERKRRQVRALVYLYDETPDARRGTREIQNELFFDFEVREAAKGLVPIMAPRDEAVKLDPNLKLGPGPALVVLSEEGKILGVLQRRLTSGALLALLRS